MSYRIQHQRVFTRQSSTISSTMALAFPLGQTIQRNRSKLPKGQRELGPRAAQKFLVFLADQMSMNCPIFEAEIVEWPAPTILDFYSNATSLLISILEHWPFGPSVHSFEKERRQVGQLVLTKGLQSVYTELSEPTGPLMTSK